MQFSERWLREFCNPPLGTQALADKLTMAGLEVEALTAVAPAFSGVVIGQIKACEPHPNADRLRVCQVDVGDASCHEGHEWDGDALTPPLLTIVCGAPNARVGIKVPCALVGAVLPPACDAQPPFPIKVSKLRGVLSHGMLCSASELGLGEAAAGLMELPADAPLGQNVRDYLALDDTVITLKLTPNLAHCLSVFGVARELSALTGAPLLEPSLVPVAANSPETLPPRIEEPALCGRFSSRVMRGIRFDAPTPQWMVNKLARCGQRSVNALVDISNYVMFEYGQPSHIFDLDKLQGTPCVRWGKKEGESLALLNGSTITTVDERVGVVADEAGPQALAGIMGGEATAVSASTRNIFIEAAFWHPAAVAGRSRRYGLGSEAGHRFERGVDPSGAVPCVERITRWVQAICGTPQTQVGVLSDVAVRVPSPKPVVLRASRASKVSGMTLSSEQCAQALKRLGLEVAPGATSDEWIVTPPSYRFDLQIEEDLIEEVVRTIGFDALPLTKPLANFMPALPAEQTRSAFEVRQALAALGYQETINFSFVSDQLNAALTGNEDPIRLLNPMAAHMNVMRSSLLGSLIEVAKYNQDRKVKDIRVFEIGRIFKKDERVVASDDAVAGVWQPLHVAALLMGSVNPLDWQGKAALRAVDFFDLKADLMRLIAPSMRGSIVLKAANGVEAPLHPALHPGRSARVYLQCSTRGLFEFGVIGELHPKHTQSYGLQQSPQLLELHLDTVLGRPLPDLQAIAKTPSVERDLAVVVSQSVTHAQFMQAVFAAKTEGLLQEAVLFDVYQAQASSSRSPASKSLAVRLTLGHWENTLTDAQIDAAVQAVLNSLGEQLGAQLREGLHTG